MYDLALARNGGPTSCWSPRAMTGMDEDADPACLIQAIARTRNRAAFVSLFKYYAPRVKSYLLRLGLDNASADELAQEVLLTIWSKAAQFDPTRATAAAWIFTIARNLRIDAARRHQGAPQPETAEDQAPEPAADLVWAAEDRTARIRDALAALPAEQADVIRLSFFDDRPHADIERALGIPLGTVKSRLRLAMLKLRGLLDKDL